jgi:CRISPR-associated endonuclease Cas1
MDRRISAEIEADDFEWRDRSQYWQAYKPPKRGAPKKFKYREPLFLCGHGVRIRIDHNTLLIRNGFTHYPQKTEEMRFFPGDGNLPDRIIILDGSGAISFDAISWMSDQKIILVQLNWRGQISAVGGAGYSANPKLVDMQLKARADGRNIEIARWLIREKIEASILTLAENIPNSDILQGAIARLEKRRAEIINCKRNFSISRLLGIEGDCAAAYFRTWHGLPLKWSGLNRKPVPDNWREVSPRTMTWRKGIQNARHPINAMLNYGYGVLKGAIQGEIIAAGLNPTIGIMHGGSDNKVPLAYDLMEPLRPVVDRKILDFALGHSFTSADFTINRNGGCRLNPQMARVVAREVGRVETNVVTSFVGYLRKQRG